VPVIITLIATARYVIDGTSIFDAHLPGHEPSVEPPSLACQRQFWIAANLSTAITDLRNKAFYGDPIAPPQQDMNRAYSAQTSLVGGLLPGALPHKR
jgi:hypothetical protein